MNLIKLVFWTAVTVVFALIVARAIFWGLRKTGVLAGVANVIEGAAGIPA